MLGGRGEERSEAGDGRQARRPDDGWTALALGREGVGRQREGLWDALFQESVVDRRDDREEGIHWCQRFTQSIQISHPSDAMSASAKRPGRNQVTLRIALSTVLTVLTLSMSSCSYAPTSWLMVTAVGWDVKDRVVGDGQMSDWGWVTMMEFGVDCRAGCHCLPVTAEFDSAAVIGEWCAEQWCRELMSSTATCMLDPMCMTDTFARFCLCADT